MIRKIIVRVYANNNGDLDGPCWTIAVGPNTIAQEICNIIEAHVGLIPNSLCLSLINALSSDTDGKIIYLNSNIIKLLY